MCVYQEVRNLKRIVVKVGTSTLAYPNGRLNIRRVERLICVLADLQNMGKEIILVSSGAIGVGAGVIGMSERPQEKREKQAAAAVGQCALMNFYGKQFNEYGHTVAQILMTKDIVENPKSKENVCNTFAKLLEYRVIPIVNENDSISTEEAEFGDNDTLSAIVAKLTGADMLVIMSDIDGLYTDNPRKNKDAKIIQCVDTIDDNLMKVAGGAGSKYGTGGMITKLQAAKMATEAGICMSIVNGKDPGVLYDVVEGKQVGTMFTV